jgi:tetratricopeptide (TPR) repeat protein
LKCDRYQDENNFARAGGLKPDWALPLLALGVSQLEAGETPKAVNSFRTARGVDPKDFRAHYLYATALARENDSDKNRAEAIAALRKAVELNPQDARSHAQLGQLQLAAGKPEVAAIEWQTTLKIEPENTTALYQLGLLYRKQGKTEAAKRLLQTFQRVKAKKHRDEESLVQMLRVVPENAR